MIPATPLKQYQVRCRTGCSLNVHHSGVMRPSPGLQGPVSTWGVAKSELSCTHVTAASRQPRMILFARPPPKL